VLHETASQIEDVSIAQLGRRGSKHEGSLATALYHKRILRIAAEEVRQGFFGGCELLSESLLK
jgi:hypothetical protein